MKKKKRPRRPSRPEPALDRANPPPARGSSGARDGDAAEGGDWEYGWRAPSRTTGTGGGPNSTF